MSMKPIHSNVFYASTRGGSSSGNGGIAAGRLGRFSNRISETFTRQYDAFRAYDMLSPQERSRCKLFSYEAVSTGKRHFLLCDLERFYSEFNSTTADRRHLYELIRDTFPCRLYFDLEFCKATNPGIDGDDLTLQWIHLILWKVFQRYGVCAGLEHIIVLDSTTPEKFSKHVHILLFHESDPGGSAEYLIRNNIEVGVFVQSILYDISHSVDRDVAADQAVFFLEGKGRKPLPEYDCFWVHGSENDGKRVCIADLGVYTRNRAFRLFNSCKYGKTRQLTIAPRDRLRYRMLSDLVQGDIQPYRKVLQYTFVVPADLLRWPDSPPQNSFSDEEKTVAGQGGLPIGVAKEIADKEDDLLTFDAFANVLATDKYHLLPFLGPRQTSSGHCLSAAGYSGASVCSISSSVSGYSVASCSIASLSSSSSSSSALIPPRRVYEVARSRFPREGSLFPLLDQFVLENLAQRGGVAGSIQSWNLFFKSHGSFPYYLLRYQIVGNRFCECIQRVHKSNGIYFDVNLMAKEVSQGCWDVDCRHYRFAVYALPSHVLPEGGVEEVEAMITRKYGHVIQREHHDMHAPVQSAF